MGKHHFPEGTIVGVNPWLTAYVQTLATEQQNSEMANGDPKVEARKSTGQILTTSDQTAGSRPRKTSS